MTALASFDAFGLSPMQRRACRKAEAAGAASPCVAAELVVEGALKDGAIEAALHELAERHEILRTAIVRADGLAEAVQVIDPDRRPHIHREDLSGVDEVVQMRRRAEAFEQPIATGSGLDASAWAGWIGRLSKTLHVVTLRFASWAADAFTAAEIVRQLHAELAACPGDEFECPVQYADFVEWQRELRAAAEIRESGERWTSGTEPKPVRMPFELAADDGRAPGPVVTKDRTLGFESVRGLERAARECDSTVTDVALATFALLLARMSGDSHACLNWLSPGRAAVELEGALGPFANWLTFGCECSPGETLRGLVHRCADTRRQLEARHYTSDDVLEATDASSSPSLLPCIEIVDKVHTRSPGLRVRLERVGAPAVPAAFVVALRVSPDQLEVSLSLDLGRVHPSAETVLEALCALLASVHAQLDTHLQSIQLTLGRRQEFLAPRLPRDVYELFSDAAAENSSRTAVQSGGRRLTFGELAERADRLGSVLAASGVTKDVPVGVLAERGPDAIVGMMAVLRAGGAFVPLDLSLPDARLAQMIESARIDRVLTAPDLGGRMPDGVTEIPLTGGDVPAPCEAPMQSSPDAVAYVLFTSGSSGTPKPVAIERSNLSAYVAAITERLGLRAGWHHGLVSSLATDLGHTVVFGALCTGGTLHIVPHERCFSAEDLEAELSPDGIDVLKIVPSHLDALLSSADTTAFLPRERLVCGGERLTWDVVRRVRLVAPDCEIWNHYGPTETTVGVLAGRIDPEASFPLRGPALGTAFPGTTVEILDATGAPVPEWVVGELSVRGAQVGRGYLLDAGGPSAYEHDEHGGRSYRAGDFGRRIPGGAIEFLGRRDDQVKLRGHRIELDDVSAALCRLAGVREAVTQLSANAKGDPVLVSYVSLQEADAGTEGLRERLSGELPHHMIPTAMVVLPALPRLASGKVDRSQLPQPNLYKLSDPANRVLPSTNLERMIAELWSELLGVDSIGIHDNFFDAGGHSILLIRMKRRLGLLLGRELDMVELFESTTIARQAAVLGGGPGKRARGNRVDAGRQRASRQRERRASRSPNPQPPEPRR